MTKLSFCVNTFNEAAALQRLLLSSLPAAAIIREWVVLDHRSSDNTQAVLDSLEPALASAGVPLVRVTEPRDLSAEFTFADLRNRTLDAAKGPLVMMLDADFVLGHAFLPYASEAVVALSKRGSEYHAATFPVPVVWDEIATDEAGRITRHGRVWWHPRAARILRWPSVRYYQDGKWEHVRNTDKRRAKRYSLRNDGDFVVSVNVKPSERLALRRTMTMFMEDATSGRVAGGWLEAYEGGSLREMPEYEFDASADLRGARLHAQNLRLP